MGIYQEAVDVFGHDDRIKKAVEETVEVLQALIHFRDGKISREKLAEEIVGCRMTLDMVVLAFDLQMEINAAGTEQLLKLLVALDKAKRARVE